MSAYEIIKYDWESRVMSDLVKKGQFQIITQRDGIILK